MFLIKMLVCQYSLFLLWKTTFVFTVNLAKIQPNIFEGFRLSWQGPPNVFVSFGSTQPALEAAKRARSRGTIAEREGNVRSYLIKLAQMEQAGVINMLSSRKKYRFKSMWVSNRILINNSDMGLIHEISDFANVSYIREELEKFVVDEALRMKDNAYEYREEIPSKLDQNATKGLELIKAPEAWRVLGGPLKAGEGVIVGVLDSGAYAGHETLIQNFVGMEYGFFDGLEVPVESADAFTHATHVTGTIVGRNGIGVAPAAKHSQCRACHDDCLESAFENCIAFFICPTLHDGTQPDCSRRVHIIQLSVLGGSPDMKPILDAAKSAGILLVAPMNVKSDDFDQCKSGAYPGLFDEVIAVGVVNHTDHLYDRSPRGPNPNPEGNPKPDVVAPGVDILSAHWKHQEYKYLTMTGPLTATAHVTGVVALLLMRDMTLTQDQMRKLIIENTDRPYPDKWGCANGSRNTWPNPEFGYGRINALKALNAQTKMLLRGHRNESKTENKCQQSFDSYKKNINENFRQISSLNIEIHKDIQRSIEDLEVITNKISLFNATLKTLLDKAKQLETSLIALELN